MSAVSRSHSEVTTSGGFTLIELMVVLAIVAILLLVATPNYDSMIIGSKVDKARYALASSLAFARTEAVKRGETVSLCLGSSDGNCGTDDTNNPVSWVGTGWRVLVAADNQTLRRTENSITGVDINYSCGDFISFGASGERRSGSGECSFSFSDSGGDPSYDKNLWINTVGRVRMN
ncbi:GspH/FimT family pseudopilin [Motiliproteus sp. MSK22-1]|uniref:GspH/FimT family pseudopilin n=1 Tax=Motiliproteus sp. MSK22-1 TaxID=1897630 RepID=UPI0009777193|nr:GspH/FimT family pseudopilin [Motiliproteus sp. MSK22-1]OMH28403.1 hypothetical protein BGP75_21125 [Motiliproteus sp. MSK22-1]